MQAVGSRPRTGLGLGLAAIAVGSLLYGCSAVLIRLSYDHGADTAAILIVRALATLPWLLLLARPGHRAATRPHAPILVAMGLLVALSISVYTLSIERMSPALATLVYYVYPVLVILGARLAGWIRLDRLTTLAAAAALGGVALTVGVPAGDVSGAGVVLALASGAGYALYLLLAERTLRAVAPLAAMAVVGGSTSLFLLAWCIPAGPELPSDGTGLALMALLLGCLVLPQALLLRGVGRIGGTWGSLVSCLELVSSIATTALVIGLPLGPGVVVGAVLIVLGGVAAPIVAARRGVVGETTVAASAHP